MSSESGNNLGKVFEGSWKRARLQLPSFMGLIYGIDLIAPKTRKGVQILILQIFTDR
jgi:hypothetical protein